jgi:hypothetical protein
MPPESILSQRRLDNDLSKTFYIPPSFWASVSKEASGYFGAQEERDASGKIENFSKVCRDRSL